MENTFETPKLSFLKIGNYSYSDGLVCDFSDVPRPFYTIAMITKGKGDFIFEQTKETVKEGDIIFIPMHSTYLSKWSEESITLSIHFQFEIPSPFPKHYKIPIQKIHFKDVDGLTKIFEDIYNAYKEKGNSFSVLGMFFTILGKVYPEIKFTRIKRLDDRIKKAVEYIENNYMKSFSVEALAKISNMSTSHFQASFKSQLGISAIEYKHRVCVRNAEIMLIENQKSIEEISYEAGFSSAIYFREIFKKITGKTPREYRKIEY